MSDEKQQKDLLVEAIRLLDEEYEAAKLFNDYYDGEEPIKVGKLEFPKSKVLFWLDREAYQEEQTTWSNDALHDEHQDCMDLLSGNGHVAPFRDLAEAVAQKHIVPFVGAGLSKPLDMPLWDEAMRRLHDRIYSDNRPEIAALINEGRFLEAAQLLADASPVLTTNFIRTTYRVRRVVGPVLLLPRIAHGCIVTTNFDDAIEEVYRTAGHSFDGYMHGTQQHNFFSRLVRGHRCLLKLHGDSDDPQTYILTRAQYLAAYEEPVNFQRPLPKALRQIFISHSLLFLGCRLENDWTLDLFRQVMQRSEYEIPNHYALLPMPDGHLAKQNKESALLELNIQPIWYPAGEHEFVERLLRLALDVADKRMAFTG